jgi:predicted phage terminase large subunit-like protein
VNYLRLRSGITASNVPLSRDFFGPGAVASWHNKLPQRDSNDFFCKSPLQWFYRLGSSWQLSITLESRSSTRAAMAALASCWTADLIIVEDTSSGMSLIQLLREHRSINVIGRRPKDDKETRMVRQQGRFEAGRILLPNQAPWLAEFEKELLAFPHGRHDDQVDTLLLALEWLSENEACVNRVIVAPIIFTSPLWSGGAKFAVNFPVSSVAQAHGVVVQAGARRWLAVNRGITLAQVF